MTAEEISYLMTRREIPVSEYPPPKVFRNQSHENAPGFNGAQAGARHALIL